MKILHPGVSMAVNIPLGLTFDDMKYRNSSKSINVSFLSSHMQLTSNPCMNVHRYMSTPQTNDHVYVLMRSSLKRYAYLCDIHLRMIKYLHENLNHTRWERIARMFTYLPSQMIFKKIFIHDHPHIHSCK